MNKEEIDTILNELKNHYILSVSEDTYLLNYIEQLQQENKQLKRKNNKAIEMFESDEHFEDGCYCEEIEKLLRGDSNEQI